MWGLDASARTFLVTIENLRPLPAYAAVDKVRLSLGGSVFVTHGWTVQNGPYVVAFAIPAGPSVSNITNNLRVGGTLRGEVSFHATSDGAANDANKVFRIPVALSAVAAGDVPTPGSTTVLAEHPRVFHANALLSVDPDDNSLWHCNFQPNEAGLTPVANSLFTFLWNNPPGRSINRFTMAARGTPSADAMDVALVRRDGFGDLGATDRFMQGSTYLARFTGSSVIILTRIQDSIANQTLTSAATIAMDTDLGNIGVLTLGHNTTFNITDGRAYQTAQLIVTQDTTGSRTFALNSAVARLTGVAAPTIKAAAGARTMLFFQRLGATWVYLGLV